MHEKIDLIIAGGGISGLSAALRAKRKNPLLCIAVIDKSEYPGSANLSGAVFEADCLDEIIPGWKNCNDPCLKKIRKNKVESESLYYLSGKKNVKIHSILVPGNLKHKKDYLVSVSELCRYLADKCRSEGIGVYFGYSIESIIIENSVAKGIMIKEQGLNRNGEKSGNYLESEKVYSDCIIIADGSLGNLSRNLIFEYKLQNNINPQVYSIGIKQLLRVKDRTAGRVEIINTLGYPLKNSQFGGGFLYFNSDNTACLGLIIALDWQCYDIQPQKEFELFKQHPFIKKLTGNSDTVAAGVKTIPEGGFYSLPVPGIQGALITGDAAGFVDISKFKGLHLAVRSGAAAGETAVQILSGKGRNWDDIKIYRSNLEKAFIYDDLKKAANFRQVFSSGGGILTGAPLSLVQKYIPFPMKIRPDNHSVSKTPCGKDYPDYPGREYFISLTGTYHRDEQPSHIKIKDPALCRECDAGYGCPCVNFCPGNVYQLDDNGFLEINSANCIHDYTCTVKCPFNNIDWTVPEGCGGPRYFEM